MQKARAMNKPQLDAIYARPEQEPFERLTALLRWSVETMSKPRQKRIVPVTAFDSQLHFIVTARKNGLCTNKEANEAIKKLLKSRKEEYGNLYNF